MRFHVLAADYDGTLAKDGHVTDSTIAALHRLRESGRKIVLVTGRRLEPILDLFSEVNLFDLIVAENGALLFDPGTGAEKLLSDPVPAELVSALRSRGVANLELGRGIVGTWQPHETTALQVIRELALDWQIIFNKDAVMLLPSGVNKAFGLKQALQQLGFALWNTVAVGDAENDEAMLRSCGISAAVDNALQQVKNLASITLSTPRGEGVEELVDLIITSDLSQFCSPLRHSLTLGSTLQGSPFSIPDYGDSVLVTGGPGGGKSKLAISVIEQLTKKGEQCCVIDPEGDYQNLENSIALGTADRAPDVEEVIGVLQQPDSHCVVSFFSIDKTSRPEYFNKLFRALAELRSRKGRPHWIIVDEAHYAAPKEWQPAKLWSDEELSGIFFITAYHDQISPAVLEHVNWIISVAENPEIAIRQCCEMMGEELPQFVPPEDNQPHKALAWRRGDPRPRWFSRLAARHEGQRHRHSYYEGEMDQHLQFVFRGPSGKLSLATGNLKEFIRTAAGVDDDTWLYHLKRHDYSKWFRDIIQDKTLANEVEDIERVQSLSVSQSREMIVKHINERYKPQW